MSDASISSPRIDGPARYTISTLQKKSTPIQFTAHFGAHGPGSIILLSLCQSYSTEPLALLIVTTACRWAPAVWTTRTFQPNPTPVTRTRTINERTRLRV